MKDEDWELGLAFDTDGRAAVEAGAEASLYEWGTQSEASRKFARDHARIVLAAVLALTKPCPTCGGSGDANGIQAATITPVPCSVCRGSGTVPLLVPREEA